MDLTAYLALLIHLTDETISQLSRLDRYTAFVAKCVITSCPPKQSIWNLVSSMLKVSFCVILYLIKTSSESMK
jgi:hypothetical protein